MATLTLSISDGGTVTSTNVYSSKSYIDIGSGNVFKLFWNTPMDTSEIDYYYLSVRRYDASTGTYYNIFTNNIGNVNEFYVSSTLLSPITQTQYQLSIYVIAKSKKGATYDITSNVVTTYVTEGCGSYVKVFDGYKQPIMKRAVAFAKVNVAKRDEAVLAENYGRALVDANGRTLYAATSTILESTNDWNVMQGSYSKDSTGTWKRNDIQYEVLVDQYGEIITDTHGDPIYIL